MNELAKSLVAARKQFNAVVKDKTNPAFRSKYADLASCIDAVDDALVANGIFVFQRTFFDATGVCIETVFLHESGERLECGQLHVPASKQDAQGYGSALTYARRYSLCAACGIAPEDDDGNAASNWSTPVNKDAKPPVTTVAPKESLDTSPAAVAKRIIAQTKTHPKEMAELISGFETDRFDAVWMLLDRQTQDSINNVWNAQQ